MSEGICVWCVHVSGHGGHGCEYISRHVCAQCVCAQTWLCAHKGAYLHGVYVRLRMFMHGVCVCVYPSTAVYM